MTDEELNRQALNFAACHGTSYVHALQAAMIIARHQSAAAWAGNAIAEGVRPSDEELAAFAEVDSLTRRVPLDRAMNDAIARVGRAPGEMRFYQAVRAGMAPADQDTDDAAAAMATRGTGDYTDALHHLARIVTLGDPAKALSAAFAEGEAITDEMAHAAAMGYMAQTGTGYMQALAHVLNTIPTPVGAQFAEPDAASDPDKGIELEIFRAGTHIDSAGKRHTFTVQTVRQMAETYDPNKREAPMVKGHPADGAPAYGWIASLRATDDGRLIARIKQWDKGFLEELKAGRYKKRSASFYTPEHPSNPTPGRFYLRHLGWLGAQQPAIAGLPNMAFEAHENDTLTISL